MQKTVFSVFITLWFINQLLKKQKDSKCANSIDSHSQTTSKALCSKAQWKYQTLVTLQFPYPPDWGFNLQPFVMPRSLTTSLLSPCKKRFSQATAILNLDSIRTTQLFEFSVMSITGEWVLGCGWPYCEAEPLYEQESALSQATANKYGQSTKAFCFSLKSVGEK